MFQQLFLAYAWAFGCVAGGILVDTCCAQKKVGGVSYTLVEKGFDTAAYGCISNCMYEKDDQPGSRFCFAYGDMEVVCGDKKESRGGDPICDEELENLLNYPNRSGPLEFRCCNEDNRGEYTNCTDLASCSKICGGNVSCIKPVGSLHYLDQCDIDKNARNARPPSALTKPTKTYCESATECPTGWTDYNCACCKYPDVYSCQRKCRCKATCDYFRTKSICSPRISGCCGCENFTCSMCTNDPVPIPTSEPITTSEPTVNCGDVGGDCSLCEQSGYRDTCAPECKCRCTCKSIVECTFPQAPSPWNLCWRDYSGCCDCNSTNSDAPRYVDVCPYVCNINDDDPQLAHVVKAGVTPRPGSSCHLQVTDT